MGLFDYMYQNTDVTNRELNQNSKNIYEAIKRQHEYFNAQIKQLQEENQQLQRQISSLVKILEKKGITIDEELNSIIKEEEERLDREKAKKDNWRQDLRLFTLRSEIEES